MLIHKEQIFYPNNIEGNHLPKNTQYNAYHVFYNLWDIDRLKYQM